MWNDTDHHLALLITFRSRGTWLHGDERGSIDRHNNIYGTPRISANKKWFEHNQSKLTGRPSYLTAKRRRIIERAIRETCSIRNWVLYAINIRTNHIHVVVNAGGTKPGMVLHALKANATRQCVKTDAGNTSTVLGWIKGASEGFGMKGIFKRQLITYCMDRATNCPNLTSRFTHPLPRVVLTYEPKHHPC
jgi:hypothetical protein